MPVQPSISAGRTGSTFGTRVYNLRHEKELSQVQLGKVVGVSGTCVWNWEEDNTFPRAAALAKLASALGTTAEYLRDGPQPGIRAPAPTDGAALAGLIQDCRTKIAEAAGLNVAAVRISLDYNA